MIDNELMTAYSYIVSARFEAINGLYIKKMSQQIREIGQLSPSNLHKLEQMAKMGANVDEITSLIAAESNRTVDEINKIYDLSGMSIYNDASKLYLAKGVSQIAFEDNVRLQNYLNSVKALTRDTFRNMSNTTIIRDNYKSMVDLAIDTVATGAGDYNSIIRGKINELTKNGISIEYASGLKRRIDSAVRMNILEGVRQINNGVRQITGEEFGADGVEISAHALCAEDHIDIQGGQFALGDKDVTIDGVTYESFDNMNASLQREISTCNCKHITFPIVLGISEPTYTDKELNSFKKNSHERFEVQTGTDKDGEPVYKILSKYDASQLMRKMETEMRYAKNEIMGAEERGDEEAEKVANNKLNLYKKLYKKNCDITGLEPKWDRTYVPNYKGKQVAPKPVTIKAVNTPQVSSVRSDTFNKLKTSLDNEYKVAYNEVKPLTVSLTENQIIERLAGGDMTGGSCSSLGFAYIGNKLGLDVLDFRGGNSQKFFSMNSNIENIAKLPNVKSEIVMVDKEASDTAKLLESKLEKGKEYYLAVGKHAAIVRKTDNGLQYLEMQSKYENGWKDFDSYGSTVMTLRKRFGCRKTVNKSSLTKKVYQKKVLIADVSSFGNEEFKEILGYINTNIDKQKKGALGHVR